MTAITFRNISIILIIIDFVLCILCIILSNIIEDVHFGFFIVAVCIAIALGVVGIGGIISYATYEIAAEEYAVPEQMSYGNWLIAKWRWECPNCGAKVSIDYTYCPECGYCMKERVERVVCPKCGGTIQKTDVFCPWCGADL